MNLYSKVKILTSLPMLYKMSKHDDLQKVIFKIFTFSLTIQNFCFSFQSSDVKCNKCNQVITQKILTALGKSWHPEHFVCRECGAPIKDPTFNEKDGEPVCVACFTSKYSDVCFACKQPIREVSSPAKVYRMSNPRTTGIMFVYCCWSLLSGPDTELISSSAALFPPLDNFSNKTDTTDKTIKKIMYSVLKLRTFIFR